MPYKSPTQSPFRVLPAGQPQLGFDPITIATVVSTWAGKLRGLFTSDGPNWTGTASKALAAAMGNTGALFEGMDARTFINYYRTNANSQTGRDVYEAAWNQLQQWDAAHPGAVPSVTAPAGVGGTTVTTAGVAGGSMTTPLVIAAVAVAAFMLLRSRK